MDEKPHDFARNKLRLAVILWAAFGSVVFSLFVWGAIKNINQAPAWKASLVGLVLGCYFFGTLLADLPLNHSASDEKLFSSLGLANHISIFRGILIILMAGLVFMPVSSGWLAWAPGVLFAAISLLDFADGAVARLTGRSTVLGERLDMRLDGAGVLIASILLVSSGRAPLIFLLAGLLRYLYLFGQWLLRKSGRPVHPLPPNPYRRVLAGMMMGFISVTLFPVFSPVVTKVAALLFLIPFLLGFGQDWLYTSGILSPDRGIKRPETLVFNLFLLAVRICTALLLIVSPVFSSNAMKIPVLVLGFFLLIGLLPRVTALAAVIFSGLTLPQFGFDSTLWAVLVLGCGSFFLGGGRLAVWSPEDWLIFRRMGEKVQP